MRNIARNWYGSTITIVKQSDEHEPEWTLLKQNPVFSLRHFHTTPQSDRPLKFENWREKSISKAAFKNFD